ncbi:MAG: DEAD/DEAH box helicase [Phycisphaerales bacterium]
MAARSTQSPRKAGAAKGRKKKQMTLSRQRRPEGMSLEQWQHALRREFGRSQAYRLENLGDHPVFSTFAVTNPTTQRRYQVTLRPKVCDKGQAGTSGGDHCCTCPDFAVNTLGTCKHIEFVLGKLERRRDTRAVLREPWQAPYAEVFVRYANRRQVIFRPGGDCPPDIAKSMAACFDEHGVLTDRGYARLPGVIAEARASGGGGDLRVSDDAMEMIARMRDRAALQQRLDTAFPHGLTDSAMAKLLRVKLYPYQKQGALFAAKAGRALIADEMGLGKTIQAIAAAELLGQYGSVQRVLIICPTSLKHQWAQEIGKFSRRTDGDVQVVEGPLHVRKQAFACDGFYKILNYDVIHRDLEAIAQWSPDLVILDEAQRIKNWKTRAAMTVKQIDSPHAIVLTGTPLENRLEELYSIVEFVDRHRLGSMFGFLAEHQQVDEAGRVIGYKHLDRIGKTLEPILIRRTKKQVLSDLPKRLDKQLFVPMTPQQQAVHDENREIVARLVAKWRRYHFLSDADQRRLMVALQYMRMSCNSTYLCDHQSDHSAKIDEAEATLSDLLEERDVKIVVFSQWVGTHELLARRCHKRDWGHVQFHGGVPGPQRKHLVQRFREDNDCRLFLSTDAGGVGLNLQHASAVVIMDQPWNPAVLEQRIGRVHRLGQKMPVRVVHLIARGTIEEGMLNIIGFKQSMFAGVLDGGAGEVFLGGTKLNRFMQSVEKATTAITAAMPPEESMEPRTDQPISTSPPQADPFQQAWSQFAAAAAAFISPLAQALASSESPAAGQPSDRSPLQHLIARDEITGQPCLKLPLPNSQVLTHLAGLLQQWTRTSQQPTDIGETSQNHSQKYPGNE